MYNRQERYASLDGLKGLLAIVIVLHHYLDVMVGKDNLNTFLNGVLPEGLVWFVAKWGLIAVEFFFAISGFVVSHNYFEKIVNNYPFKKFISNRVKKIYPSVACCMIIAIVINILDNQLTGGRVITTPLSFWRILLSFGLMAGWFDSAVIFPCYSSAWFICVLFLCYLIYYMLCKLYARHKEVFLSVCVGIVFLGLAFAKASLDIPFLYHSLARGYASFFLGVVLYEINKWNANWRLLAIVGCGITVGVMISSYVWGFNNIIGDVRGTFVLFFIPVAILSALHIRSIRAVLECKLCLYLGEISMAMYLTHVLVLHIIKISYISLEIELYAGKGMFLSIVLLVISLVAILWHELLEKRFMPKVVREVQKLVLYREG